MKAKQVEAFDAVMTSGSVKRAAALLNVSQPAVSRTIDRLERQVGFALFERRGRGLRATREALLLHEEVQRAFMGLGHLEATANAIRRFQRGQLRVVTLPVIASRILPGFVCQFARDYPEIPIRIDVSTSFNIPALVRACQYDVGITILPVEDRGLGMHTVARGEHLCVLPPGHRLGEREVVTPGDLRGERFISYPAESTTRRRIDRIFEEAGVERVTLIEGQTDTICELVARGAGVSIVGCVLPQSFPPGGLLWRRFRPRIDVAIVALRQEEQPSARIVGLFVDAFREFAKVQGLSA